jgi:hypothetical protein
LNIHNATGPPPIHLHHPTSIITIANIIIENQQLSSNENSPNHDWFRLSEEAELSNLPHTLLNQVHLACAPPDNHHGEEYVVTCPQHAGLGT